MIDRYDPRSTPWNFDDDDFYEHESRREQIEFLLRYAVLAPSSHNRQPWIFKITAEGVEVSADPTRCLAAIDPDDRELTLSIGAAIANLRVAAAHFGFESTVSYETSGDSAPLATVTLRETCDPDRELGRLFSAIKRRHTNRAPFVEQIVDPDALAIVLDVIDHDPETFHIVLPREKSRAADLIELADRAQMADPAYRSELSACIHASADAIDGLPADSLGIPHVLAAATPFLLRHHDFGPLHARQDHDRAMSAAGLLVVCAEDDSTSLLRAGEALEILLLTFTRSGLQYSFLNAPIQRAELRDRVATLAGCRQPPQLILRFGQGRPVVSPAPRRPVAAVVG